MHKYIFFICLEDLWLQNLTLWVYVVHQFSGVIHNDFYLKGLKYKELLLWIQITISFRWLLVWGSRVSWISTRLEQAMALGVGWKTKRFQSSAGGRILPSSILPHHEMVWVTSEVSGGLLILSLNHWRMKQTPFYSSLGLVLSPIKIFNQTCSELEGRHQPEQLPPKWNHRNLGARAHLWEYGKSKISSVSLWKYGRIRKTAL